MNEAPSTTFEPHRRRLIGLAYRMLGTMAESEDVVQDAYLKWHDTDRDTVRDTGAFLSTIVTRLCLDRLREARRKRESYVGPWLPEPMLVDAANDGHAPEQLAEDVSFALMLALERLSPLERAAFLLHDVFELDFEEVAATLERSPSACRQLASRARNHVQADRPRFTVPSEQQERLVSAFFHAAHSGQTDTLQGLLSEDATFHSDGGGRKTAALRPIVGPDRIARLLQSIARRASQQGPLWSERRPINGLPGALSVERDGTLQTTALEINRGRITAIYVVRNPDKLTHLLSRVPAEIRACLTDGTSN